MKENVKCGLCGFEWRCHGYQRQSTFYYHFKEKHPGQLARIKVAKKKYQKVLKENGWIELDRII